MFGKVYDLHYGTLFNYCYKRTQDFDSSKDITSETFLKAFLSINKFEYRGISLLSWLYKIAINEINLHYRSKKYRPKLLSELGSDVALQSNPMAELQDEKAAAEAELAQHKQFVSVQHALRALPLKYQEVVSLKYFEKLKIREISDILDKPEGTIKSLLSRGIQLLKNQYVTQLFFFSCITAL